MRRIIVPDKGYLLLVTFIVICFIFVGGFLLGNVYGEAIPVLNQRLVPIYKVDHKEKMISITLDGTWGAEYTEKILNILDDNDVHITFFFAGYWLEKYPELVKEIAARGHEIENHTFTHPHCNSLSEKNLREELEKTSNYIKNLIGKKPRFFRPPYGEYNNKVIKIAEKLGYQVVQWSIDSLDWQEPGVDSIVRKVLNNVENGDIVLMHNNAPDTPDALKRLIPELKEKGYEIVPLSELIYKDNYYIESHSGKQVKQKRALNNRTGDE